MAYIKVRNLPDEVVLELNRLATESGQTRESFLRERIFWIAAQKDLEEEIKDREVELFQKLLPQFEKNNQLMERVVGQMMGEADGNQN